MHWSLWVCNLSIITSYNASLLQLNLTQNRQSIWLRILPITVLTVTMQRVQPLLNGRAKSNSVRELSWRYPHLYHRYQTVIGLLEQIKAKLLDISGRHIVWDLLETFIALPRYLKISDCVWLIQKRMCSKTFVFNTWIQVCWPAFNQVVDGCSPLL